jgi:Na+/proline symporter
VRLFWRGATRTGAILGLVTGFVLWAYCSFLPSFGEGRCPVRAVFDDGLFGLSWLRPQALFGTEGMDPLIHALFWSMTLNAFAFCLARF